MVTWFAELIKEKIWQALVDSVKDLLNKAESEVEDYLRDKDEIEKGKNLSTNPLVKVLYVNEDEDTLTLLLRGRFKLFKDAITSAFTRIEVIISRDVDFTLSSFPIDIKEWRTIIADISFGKKNVFDAALTLGYDNGVWLGGGKVKILPAGFGLDVFSSQGINDQGGVFEIDTDFSAPIPLGSTGVYLEGIVGELAFNFIPRLENEGVPVARPTAEHYTAWAFNHETDRWKFGPIEETASGIAIGADLADKTRSMRLEPAGLAVLTPGPVFILGGKGILLNSASTKLKGYIVVDVASDSLALGLAAKIKIPASGSNKLIEGHGVLDAFFPFKGSSLWHINFGTEKKPIKAKILKDVFRCDLYLMISQSKIQFGAGISIGGEWKWKIITFTARIGARAGATIGWNPRELLGEFEINGELGIAIWKLKFILKGFARVIGNIPEPNKLGFELEYKLKLPWPAPTIKGKKTISYSDEEPLGPPLESPLLVGTSTTKRTNTTTKGPLKCAGIHALTGRQWELGETPAWPDLDIVVQFHRRARDTTGTIIGPAISPENNGGWNVDHVITKIKLKDKVNDAVVRGIQGVWAAGPDGDTPRLHLLGQDPFSWLISHPHAFAPVKEIPAAVVYQKFGYGPDECFTDSKRFGNMKVKPNLPAHLVSAEPVGLQGRVMECSKFKLIFSDVSKQLIDID
ncbi:MAG: hypothetical protein PVH61_37740 [Candidatus Aminicenantes bacterium]|jgi:hypothetical protein